MGTIPVSFVTISYFFFFFLISYFKKKKKKKKKDAKTLVKLRALRS